VNTFCIDKTVRWNVEKSFYENSSESREKESARQYSQHRKRHDGCKLSVFSEVVVQSQITPKTEAGTEGN